MAASPRTLPGGFARPSAPSCPPPTLLFPLPAPHPGSRNPHRPAPPSLLLEVSRFLFIPPKAGRSSSTAPRCRARGARAPRNVCRGGGGGRLARHAGWPRGGAGEFGTRISRTATATERFEEKSSSARAAGRRQPRRREQRRGGVWPWGELLGQDLHGRVAGRELDLRGAALLRPGLRPGQQRAADSLPPRVLRDGHAPKGERLAQV